ASDHVSAARAAGVGRSGGRERALWAGRGGGARGRRAAARGAGDGRRGRVAGRAGPPAAGAAVATVAVGGAGRAGARGLGGAGGAVARARLLCGRAVGADRRAAGAGDVRASPCDTGVMSPEFLTLEVDDPAFTEPVQLTFRRLAAPQRV